MAKHVGDMIRAFAVRVALLLFPWMVTHMAILERREAPVLRSPVTTPAQCQLASKSLQ